MHDRRGEASPPPSIRSGAVCFPQRFGGSLNLNVHYYVAVPDGVFRRELEAAQSAVFHQLAIPHRSDLETIGHAVELRVLGGLRRGGLLDAVEAQPAEEDAEGQRDALDACLRGSLGIGELWSLPYSASAAGQGTDEVHQLPTSAHSPAYSRLLKRVHDVDALACACGGRLRVIALITEPEVVVAILSALRFPTAPPPIARARSPDYDPRPD